MRRRPVDIVGGLTNRALEQFGLEVRRKRGKRTVDPAYQAIWDLPPELQEQYGPHGHVLWRPWLSDPEFLNVWATVGSETALTPDRCWLLWSLAKQTLTGANVAECGVYRGGSS